MYPEAPGLLDEPEVPEDVPLEPDVLESDDPVPVLLSMVLVPVVVPPMVDPAGGGLAPALEPLDSANAGEPARRTAETATASFAVFIVSSMLRSATAARRMGCWNYDPGCAGFRCFFDSH